MTNKQPRFELPAKIEQYLAALSKVYAQEGKRERQEIIVNAQVRVVEEWTYDNWNGGTYGHALYLTVPDNLYLRSVRKRSEIQGKIKKDINQLHDIPDEFIAEVFLEMEEKDDEGWRESSGVLQTLKRTTTPDAAKRIWGEGGYRVFLSHKANAKKDTATLKERLEPFGIASFVAHKDISPTKEWQDEIENALASMDAFVALLTEDFHDSDWTDQEVGFALARAVPIVAVKLGRDPYGFIGKFQALSCDWDAAPKKIVELLIQQPRMLEAYISALPKCRSFDEGNLLAEALPAIERLTEGQAERMVAIYNTDSQLSGSYGFNGAWSSKHGPGLAFYLSRITGQRYVVSSDKIQRAKPK